QVLSLAVAGVGACLPRFLPPSQAGALAPSARVSCVVDGWLAAKSRRHLKRRYPCAPAPTCPSDDGARAARIPRWSDDASSRQEGVAGPPPAPSGGFAAGC